MSDIKHTNRYTGVDRRKPRVEASATKASAGVPRDAYKPAGRHSAITNNLYNFHSYKSWADKMRGSWEDKK